MSSGTCRITKRACKWAARCLYAEGAGRKGMRGGALRTRPLDMCAVAAERNYFECRGCPEKRRCAKVWRCWRAEQYEKRSPLVGALRRIDGRNDGKAEFRVAAGGAE